MKIVLAGATGAVGRLLLPLLVQAGHDVAGTTRSAAKADQIAASGARPVVLNALDREATLAALIAERPDAVIHQLTDLAGRDFAANSRLRVEGTRNLVDASKAAGVQRMITQGISWVAAPGSGLATENDPLDLDAPPPHGQTVASVHTHEQATMELPVGVVLRYGYLYGPGTWHSRDGLVTEQLRRGEITATGGVSSFIHVADAAQAALLALDWPAGIYNIVDDEPAADSEWLAAYASLVGAPPPRVQPGSEAWQRGESNAKAKALGWQPRYPSWREGFKAALA